MKITKRKIRKKQQDDQIYHGYTCCSYDGCEEINKKYGALIPTEDGWICPCGKYKQEYR
jgi:hypothetical protein